MASIAEEKMIKEQLYNKIDKITAKTVEQYTQRERLGTGYSLAAATSDSERILKLLKRLKAAISDEISYDLLKEIDKKITETAEVLSRMESFSPEDNRAEDNKRRIISDIGVQYRDLFKLASPIIAIGSQNINEINENILKSTEFLNEISNVRKELIADLESAKKQSDEILSSMRDATARTGISRHANIFKEEAEDHKNIAKKWLIANISLGAAALGLAAYSIYYYASRQIEVSTAQSIQIGIAKLITFSILYFGLVWTSRNYRAHRHNFVINQHRQNALNTFESFVEGTSDDHTKNAVLVKSTEAVFSPIVTGYLTKEPEPQGGTQILEVIRNVMGKQQ
jgi:hypothetical protein